MKKPRVIDANIILRFLTNDNPEKASACEALLLRVEPGQEEVFLPDLVIADIVWTLEKFYQVDKSRIREMIIPILAAKGMTCTSKGRVLLALEKYAKKNVDWTDAFVAAQMMECGYEEIYSYDRDFDKLPGMVRIEPR